MWETINLILASDISISIELLVGAIVALGTGVGWLIKVLIDKVTELASKLSTSKDELLLPIHQALSKIITLLERDIDEDDQK